MQFRWLLDGIRWLHRWYEWTLDQSCAKLWTTFAGRKLCWIPSRRRSRRSYCNRYAAVIAGVVVYWLRLRIFHCCAQWALLQEYVRAQLAALRRASPEKQKSGLKQLLFRWQPGSSVAQGFFHQLWLFLVSKCQTFAAGKYRKCRENFPVHPAGLLSNLFFPCCVSKTPSLSDDVFVSCVGGERQIAGRTLRSARAKVFQA